MPMSFIIFLAISPQEREPRTLQYGDQSLDACLEFLTNLAGNGWQLIHIELVDNGRHTQLPIEAFDGLPMKSPLRRLHHEWKTLLA